MAERIRQLEEALAVSHAKTSRDPHTLLVPTEDTHGDRSLVSSGTPILQNNDVIDAFGTLSIGSDGRSKYHNQSAGADVSVQFFGPIRSPMHLCLNFSVFRGGKLVMFPIRRDNSSHLSRPSLPTFQLQAQEHFVRADTPCSRPRSCILPPCFLSALLKVKPLAQRMKSLHSYPVRRSLGTSVTCFLRMAVGCWYIYGLPQLLD